MSDRHGSDATGPDGIQRRRPRADAARNRQRVSDAAVAVFAERGLSATVAQVAERADVGNATVFRNFATKEDLLSEVATRWLAEWGEVLDQRVSADAGADTLADLIAEVVERFRQNKLALDLLRAGDLDDRMSSARAHVEARFTEALQRAQRAGLVRADVTYGDLTLLILGMAGRLSDEAALDPVPWRRLADLTWAAIRA
ncbi:TetR/AcrR family transcriptional regulator [Nocardioides houyundeii]|uniref:TetR/AcrR family transcriptional regulator n=1 Tax=Nocardioides houyundeii TaxID=2045452 RepID=UPI000DF35A8C|nr:TetR/AcrR family transcriptional regulator [Nocardioides houyundeii]